MTRPIMLHCVGWVTRGGVERRRALLAKSSETSGFEHVLICQVATAPLRQQIQAAGWVLHEIGFMQGLFDFGWYRRAYLLAAQLNPSVIHGAVSEGNILATFLGIALRKPRVIIEETSDFRGRRVSGDIIFWLMALRAQAVVGVAPEISKMLRKRLPGLAHKVRTISNGVEPHPHCELSNSDLIRSEYGIRAGDIVLGSSGRLLDSHKRFSDIIRVVSRLSNTFPNLKLMIVGGGADRDSLEALASSLGIHHAVAFTGFQESPRKFLNVMDIFVLASSGEALPLALIEAMHAGLPSVASRVGGNHFVLDGGQSGLLFTPGNLDDLELRIRTLLESPELRLQLGGAAKTRAEEKFNAQRYVREVVGLWNELARLPR